LMFTQVRHCVNNEIEDIERPWGAPEGWCPQIWVFEAQKSVSRNLGI
jgi:hypothetical protein